MSQICSGSSSDGPSSTSSNWDMINRVIEENEGNDWYIPKEGRYNAWTCPVIFTIGNIDLRDFVLERRFADMRHKRVEAYDKKWQAILFSYGLIASNELLIASRSAASGFL